MACPLALAVAASRVVTGVHYPSDVLAGLAIGTAAAASTLLWWPRRPAS
ncbi:MAG: phosphatase PAP2 family protein [Streptosporangiaceae bacterium]